jgi:hypothetical protein
MAYGDGSKSGGRKPGSKNRLTLEKLQLRQEAAKKINDALGEDDFKGSAVEFLQACYKMSGFDIEFRKDAAEKVAQYETAKKTEATIEDKTQYVVHMPAPVANLEEWVALHINNGGTPVESETEKAWNERIARLGAASEAKGKTKN